MNKHFLLVDDDYDDAELFCEALKQADSSAGFNHVPEGEKLFTFLRTENKKPDIIFLDINLPGLTGWQCLQRLKDHEAYKTLPVIMYSNIYDLDDHEMARRMQALGLLTKPSSYTSLVGILSTITRTELDDMEEVLKTFLK